MDFNIVQRKLSYMGMYDGTIDGINGPRTKSAVMLFQKRANLIQDGIVGTDTLKALGINNSIYPKYSQLTEFYGPKGSNLVSIALPYTMKLSWYLDFEVNKLSCNKRIADPLTNIFKQTLEHYGIKTIQDMKLDIYGGCFNKRKMRGGSKWSTHSWGIAVDLAPEENQLKWGKDKALFAKPEYDAFWDIVESNGATSLGRKKNYDYMHFQFCGI